MYKGKLLLTLLFLGVITGCTNYDKGYIDAKSIALRHAKIGEESVVGLKVEEDWDALKTSYEVSFYDSNYEYDYKIDRNGVIMKCEKEMMRYPRNEFLNQEVSITEEEATAIAVQDSGIHQDSIENLRLFKKHYHGIKTFYIKFSGNKFFYEYKIASNGDIIDVEISKIN